LPIERAARRLISAVSDMEAAMVLEGRPGPLASVALDDLSDLSRLSLALIEPLDQYSPGAEAGSLSDGTPAAE